MESYKQLFFNDTELFITHGHNYSPDNLPKNINENTIFCFGHTHIPEAYTKDNIYILNPGSITLPKGGSANSYAVITDNEIAICNLEKVTTKKLQLF
jgi:putative phosphoesterase